MKRKLAAGSLTALGLALAAAAVTPQKVLFRGFEDFLRGKFDGISVSADGALALGPREERLAGPSEDFYLSYVMTPEGTSYLGTGHEGKVYRLGQDGKAELYFQAPEMDVTSLAVDKKGNVYAGTSPNGKIYKISSPLKGEEFFNPAERYIWELLVLENGNLLAAVGESGGIYEISPQGEGRLVHKAAENHVLCLKLDRGGHIIAGSGGPGSVYRIEKSGGKAAVIFETPFEEVRSLAFDLDGRIYAAAGGTPSRGRDGLAPPAAGRQADVSVSVSSVAAAPVSAGSGQAAGPGPAPRTAAAAAEREPGAVYRIMPDGLADRIWVSAGEMPYSLYWTESEKRVYVGTGPRGRLYALDGEGRASLVLEKNSEQIFACLPVGTRVYLLGNNPAELSLLHPERRLDGEYTSPVSDARLISAWGRIAWESRLPPGASLQFQTRSGNVAEPGPSWSDWSPPYQAPEGEPILSPRARYLQFRVLFKSPSGKTSPELDRVHFHFLQANAAPKVGRVELLGSNEVLLKPPDMDEAILGLERRRPDAAAKRDDLRFVAAKKVERKGYQTLQWEAEDENGDVLLYTVSMKSDAEKNWRILDDRWTETTYAFNTVHFPDGIYTLKVTASDAPSNPPGLEKTGERSAGPLVIDNTAPAITEVKVARQGGELTVGFRAEDAFSEIRECRVLVRPGDWRTVFPEDGICDSKSERFAVRIPLPPGTDDLLTITVRDAMGNIAVHRVGF